MHPCSECSAEFSLRKNLLRHQRQHQGERHICPECQQSFRRGDYLSRHRQLQHGLQVRSRSSSRARHQPVESPASPTPSLFSVLECASPMTSPAPAADSQEPSSLHDPAEESGRFDLPGNRVDGSGSPFVRVSLIGEPGEIYRWTDRTNLFLVNPLVITGVEVPVEWPRSTVMSFLRINEADLFHFRERVTVEQERVRQVHYDSMAGVAPVAEETLPEDLDSQSTEEGSEFSCWDDVMGSEEDPVVID